MSALDEGVELGAQDRRSQGLIAKFDVRRLVPSSRGVDHSDCRYFVLDPAHDPLAREALRLYMVRARAEGYSALSDDLNSWLADIRVAESRATEAVREAALRAALERLEP